MVRLADVLLIDDPILGATDALLQKLQEVGTRTGRARTEQEIRRISERPHFAFRAVLAPVGLAPEQVHRALEPLRSRLEAGSLAGFSFGPRAEPALRVFHEKIGLRTPLFEPFDPAMLRFQLNRGLGVRPATHWRREERRAPFGWETATRLGARVKPVRLYTLSPDGAFLETPRPWSRGARFELLLDLPRGPVSAAAEVVYTNVPGNITRPAAPFGMGVRFEGLGRPCREEIRDLVSQWERSLGD